MNLHRLEILCRLADCNLSVSAVANAMHTTQPNVTRHLQALEREIGAPLFVRSKRRILSYTEVGRQVLRSARRVVQEVEDLVAIRSVQPGDLSGTMTIAASHTQARYALPSIVQDFMREYPKMRVVLRQGDPKQILNWVATGNADIAICSQPPIWPKNLAFFECKKHSRILIAPRSHPVAKLRKPALSDVAQYPLITYDDSFGVHSRIVEAFETRGLVPNIVLTATDVDVMKAYVRYGLGIAIVASLAYDEGDKPALRAIDVNHLFDPVMIKIVLRKGSYVRPYVYDFIRRLSPTLALSGIRAVLGSHEKSGL